MGKYLTAIFFFAGLFMGVFFIMKHEKKRKQDKTVLVDTTSENWTKRRFVVGDIVIDTTQIIGFGISNDSTIMISNDSFDERFNALLKSVRELDSTLTLQEKEAVKLQKEINQIKRKLDMYFAPDTFSIEAVQPGDFILLADTIIWKAN